MSMKKFSLLFKGTVFLVLSLFLLASQLSAQSVSANLPYVVRPIAPNTISVNLTRGSSGWGSSGTYTWSVSPSTGVTIGSYSQTGTSAANVTVTFSAAASGNYTFTLTRGSRTASVTVTVGNITASSANGDQISVYSVTNGTYNAGGDLFSPTVSTAAIGISPSGHHYYLPNTYFGNNGAVTIYAANPDGTGNRAIASLDLNGTSNNDLGFVRLAVDATGVGWILAGDNSTLYLARFATNGTSNTTITIVDNSVTLVNGTASTFFNGDICFSGNGTMYALANSSTGGVTQIFIGTPNGSNTTLTKKWDLVDQNGNPFTGSVNGVAFDILGSLYISTSLGLYYINQNTVNTATGTVQCSLVRSVLGLTDLGSNVYPQQTTLPVQLLSFTGTYRNQVTTLNWATASELNFSHFEIERSTDGISFQAIGTKQASGNNGDSRQYGFTDDLSAVNGTSFSYRLKAVDRDGNFKYSNVITVRKETRNISGIVLNPSPVTNGTGTVRFTAVRSGVADLKVVDLTGRVLLQQKEKIYEGNNSISINNLSRLQPGNYVLQLVGDEQQASVKFNVIR